MSWDWRGVVRERNLSQMMPRFLVWMANGAVYSQGSSRCWGKSRNDFGPVGLWSLETVKSSCPAGSWICESELDIQFGEN